MRHVSHVMCQMSHSMYHMSHVTFHISQVTYRLPPVTFHLAPVTYQTWKKTIFFTQARFHPELFYPKKCANFDKSEFATKKSKMYLTTKKSKTRLPQIYRG